MIALLVGALLMQSETEDSLQRATERMDEAAKSMHEAATRKAGGDYSREGRLKSVDRSVTEQEAALKLIDELLKSLEEESGCEDCKKGGG